MEAVNVDVAIVCKEIFEKMTCKKRAISFLYECLTIPEKKAFTPRECMNVPTRANAFYDYRFLFSIVVFFIMDHAQRI